MTELAMQRVLTQAGWVEGETRAAHQVFRGIPFVKAPVGALRLRAPEPAEPTGVDSWIAFTRTGDPSITDPNQPWPAYDLERRPTLVFDLESSLQLDPYGEERAAWDGLSPGPPQ